MTVKLIDNGGTIEVKDVANWRSLYVDIQPGDNLLFTIGATKTEEIIGQMELTREQVRQFAALVDCMGEFPTDG